MLTKQQMYMLIGFIVIIIVSLVILPETDGFKSFWDFLKPKKKKNKNSGVCSKRGLVDNGNGQCVPCISKDKATPVWNNYQKTCTSCGTIDSAKPYYSPSAGCVKFCPTANLNSAGDAVIPSNTDASATATWQDKGLASATERQICRT